MADSEGTPAPARWFPERAPALPGESDDDYTNRLTGARGPVPYDHWRNRQCSIGYHGECSDPAGERCKCPCHTAEGKLELRAWELEESVVAAYAIASGRLPEGGTVHPGWAGRLLAGTALEVREITTRRPKLAEWYLRPEETRGLGSSGSEARDMALSEAWEWLPECAEGGDQGSATARVVRAGDLPGDGAVESATTAQTGETDA